METLLPFLEIASPDGQSSRMELKKDRVTIGRFDLFNDVGLEPDPQQLITRKGHCTIERDADGWWVVDNGSVNGTFLRKGTEMEKVRGRALLKEGDCIHILGKFTEAGEPVYWQLTFNDPLGTRPAPHEPVMAYLEYDWLQARLFRVDELQRQEIRNLRPQEHKLIRYMDQRNRANGNVPVMCTTEELLSALFGDEPAHTEAEVVSLVSELRQKLEPDRKNPRFLETVRGFGYRLVTHPVK